MIRNQLEAIFAEMSAETAILVMDELGYAPKPERGAVVLSPDAAEALVAALGYTAEQLSDPSGKSIDSLQKATQAAVKAAADAAKKETLAYVQSIHDICALGGRPEMAPALIAKEASIEDVRKEILEAKAKDAGRTQIDTAIGGVSAEGANPLLEDAKKAAASFAARMR